MATKKFWSEFHKFASRGYGEVTSSRWVSTRVHPRIASQLLSRGWAEYEKDAKGFVTNIIKITDTGRREADVAESRSLANASN